MFFKSYCEDTWQHLCISLGFLWKNSPNFAFLLSSDRLHMFKGESKCREPFITNEDGLIDSPENETSASLPCQWWSTEGGTRSQLYHTNMQHGDYSITASIGANNDIQICEYRLQGVWFLDVSTMIPNKFRLRGPLLPLATFEVI